VIGVLLVTVDVVAVNVWLLLPAATVTVGNWIRPDGLLAKVKEAPPAGAGPLRVMAPDTGLPPVALAGVKLRFDGTTDALLGFTVTTALCETLL
jgi:hypothetical protein